MAKTKHPMPPTMIEEVSSLFRALGHTSRLQLVEILMRQDQALNQGQLAELSGMSQACASKHLACLCQAGLVHRETNGTMALYSIKNPLIFNLCSSVCQHVEQRALGLAEALSGHKKT